MQRNQRFGTRRYPRMVRVNELLREIIGEELRRYDIDEVGFLTVTGVECGADLRYATVYFDGPGGPETDETVLEALEEVRRRLQRAIGAQARMKRTPELRFVPDPAVRAGERIEAVLRGIDSGGTSDEPGPSGSGPDE